MHEIQYKLSVAGWSIDSAADLRTELVELETRLSMNGALDECRVTVYAPPAPKPGLLEQAVGAAMEAVGLGAGTEAPEGVTVAVRGETVKTSDQMGVELCAGDHCAPVMTARVETLQSSFGLTRITGRTSAQQLATTRLNQIYLNQTLGQIVRDLAGQAGIATGEIESGSTYPYFVVHESKSLWRILQQLAQREGLDLYFSTDNKLTMVPWSKTSADHTLHYGIDILDLVLTHHPPTSTRLKVYGESPSSQQGTNTWPWLARDPAVVSADMGDGNMTTVLTDGALRAKAATDKLAAARLGSLTDAATRGRLKLLGRPTLKLGDALEIKGAPKPELDGLFKAVAVRHVFTKRAGFVTLVEFTGQGGGDAAGGLLGQLGALASGVGL